MLAPRRSFARLCQGFLGLLGVSIAVLSASVAQGQTSPAPAPLPGRTWVWTTLPAMPDNAKIEYFDPARPTNDERPEEDDDTWRTMCLAPCNVWIASGTRLRVNGDFRVGAPFTLPVTRAVTLDVKPGQRAPGIAVISVSGSVFLLSGLVYLLSTLHFSDDPRSTAIVREDRQKRNAFFAVAGISLAGVGTGVALLLTQRKTTVDVRTAGAPVRIPLAGGFSISPAGVHF